MFCCHAVLEWLANLEEVVEHLARFLRPEWRLRLMLYTATPRYSRGRWKGISLSHSRRASRSEGGGAKGPTSLAEDTVREWLDHRGLRVRSRAVTRIIRDHVPEDLQQPERSRELLKAEKRLSSKEPFASPWASTRTWCANEATSRSACGREPAKLSHASLGFRISARFGGVMCGAAGPRSGHVRYVTWVPAGRWTTSGEA
jgi:hypothetical protein